MHDLEAEIAAITTTVQPEWDDDHAFDMGRVFARRYRRRKSIRAVAGAAAIVALVIGGVLTVNVLRAEDTRTAPVVASTDPLVDGLTATPASADCELAVVTRSPARTTIALRRGGASFAIAKPMPGELRVEAGAATVEVFATKFAVYRVDTRVRVAVDEGRVRVLWENQQRELTSGEAGVFPPEPPSPPVAVDEPQPLPSKPEPTARPAKSWRDLANDGDYDKAYEALRKSPRSASDRPADLLLVADVHRLSHHPAEAVAPLRRILSDHRDDRLAPLAAFTLGRVFLEELGQPSEAAEAFAETDALAPNGALAQDALAREVEAWSRAGEDSRAHARAEEYVKRYPDGRRIRSVRRFGGIE